MKKKIDWFFDGTYLYYLFLAAGTFGWGLNFKDLVFMKVIGVIFAILALISIGYSFFKSLKK